MHSPHFKWHEESRIYDFVQYRELPMSAMTPVLVSFPVAVLKYPDKKHLGENMLILAHSLRLHRPSQCESDSNRSSRKLIIFYP